MDNKSFIVIRIYLILVLMAMVFVGVSVYRCCGAKEGNGSDTIKVEKVESHDTIYIEKHDTMPVEVGETIVKYIKVPVYTEHSDTVVVRDSVDMAVVQKTYSDDSTYTAYVSGLDYEQWPKLDSITVRQRNIETIVERTITVRKKLSRWGICVIGGYGIGIINRKPEPYIGLGVSYTILPL